jgi:hypothetical protein
MRRLLAAWLLAVLAGGCGTDDKKPADPPESKPNPMFDHKHAPRGAKKSGPSMG